MILCICIVRMNTELKYYDNYARKDFSLFTIWCAAILKWFESDIFMKNEWRNKQQSIECVNEGCLYVWMQPYDYNIR